MEPANAQMDTSSPYLLPGIAEDAPTTLLLAAATLKPLLVLPTSTLSTEFVSAHQEDTSTTLETACPASPIVLHATHLLNVKPVLFLTFFKETPASQDADLDTSKTDLSALLALLDALCAKAPIFV